MQVTVRGGGRTRAKEGTNVVMPSRAGILAERQGQRMESSKDLEPVWYLRCITNIIILLSVICIK